ncbi:MAG: hypothetical protein ABI346_05570 [Candidatus Baltobacteraceae bacterium]
MLLNALFLSAVLTVLTSLLGEIALLGARETYNDEVRAVIDVGSRHGISTFERAVFAGVTFDRRSGDFILPTFARGQKIDASPLVLGGYRIVDTVTVAGAQDRLSSGPDVATNSQRADKLAEQRVSIRVGTTVYATNDDAVVGRETAFVTLRLFGQHPFVEVAGALTSAAADPAHLGSSAHEGDTGGNTFPLDRGLVTPADTGLHLVFRCNGNVNDCQFSNPPVDRGYRGDGFGDVRWTTGNENGTHWSY